RMSAEDRLQVDDALARGMGVASYGGLTIAYGTREAVLPGLPPRMYADNELGAFVAPAPTPASTLPPGVQRRPLRPPVGQRGGQPVRSPLPPSPGGLSGHPLPRWRPPGDDQSSSDSS